MYKALGVIIIGVFVFSYAYAQEMHHEQHEGMDMPEQTYDQDLGICPVLHEPASKDYAYTYNGKTYYFCCSMCIDEFKKDPEKYINKIKEINLEAYQFGFEPERIVVKKGDIVKLMATSRDVTHGIYIKEYGINVPVKKGETKKIEFVADQEGTFPILCAVYCGKGHSAMKAELVVEKE